MWLQPLVNWYINSASYLAECSSNFTLIYQPFVLSVLECELSERAAVFLLHALHNGLPIWATENNHVGSRQPYKCLNTVDVKSPREELNINMNLKSFLSKNLICQLCSFVSLYVSVSMVD